MIKLKSKTEAIAKVSALHNKYLLAAEKELKRANAEIGDIMDDGTIYAGESPIYHTPMYLAPSDAPLLMSFNAAAEYAENLQVGDKEDFRIPEKEELQVIFDNRNKGALKGTFNLSGSNVGGWYMSFTLVNDNSSRSICFSDGSQKDMIVNILTSVRCVR